MKRSKIREKLGLQPIINVSGSMTSLGSSIIHGKVIESMIDIMPEFVLIDELMSKISEVISRLCGSESGFVTACSSSGITLSIAGMMTQGDLYKTELLPDTDGMKNKVVAQAGHLVHYGASVRQAIRLSGAQPVSVGTATLSKGYQLEGSIDNDTACALYLSSHHVVDYGQIPFEEFLDICHQKNIPVIVDAAAQRDLKGFLLKGADIVIYSGHKFLGGPTSGIVAGSKKLIEMIAIQNRGIGRGMKVGKESMLGVMTALEIWEKRDHQKIRKQELSYLKYWQERLSYCNGLESHIVPDPSKNPVDRLQVLVDPIKAGMNADELSKKLRNNPPPIIVRSHGVEHGYFYLDPCNLHEGEAEIVAEGITNFLK